MYKHLLKMQQHEPALEFEEYENEFTLYFQSKKVGVLKKQVSANFNESVKLILSGIIGRNSVAIFYYRQLYRDSMFIEKSIFSKEARLRRFDDTCNTPLGKSEKKARRQLKKEISKLSAEKGRLAWEMGRLQREAEVSCYCLLMDLLPYRDRQQLTLME